MSTAHAHHHEDIPKIVAYFIPFIPTILVKLSVFYLRVKGMARKSGIVFKKELLRNGIDEDTAERFTREYMKSSHVLRMMRHQS